MHFAAGSALPLRRLTAIGYGDATTVHPRDKAAARKRHADTVPYLTDGGKRLRALGGTEQVAALLGAALRSSGRAVKSEAVLHRLLDSMDPDARSGRYAAYQLAETSDALGRVGRPRCCVSERVSSIPERSFR
jgi:hypothetical protein